MKLYKFKAGTERDINALMNDQLWVSTLELMNDPIDLGFYLNGKYKLIDIIEFQKALNLSIVVASFSNVIQNRRLWNYYSNGMRGLVLTYRSEELVKGFGRLGDEFGGRAFAGIVSYGPNKYDLTDEFEKYLKTNEVPAARKDFGLLFHKDESWKEEKEYRIAMTIGSSNGEKGFLLRHVRPYEVGIGYRMEKPIAEKVKKWCIDNHIILRKYYPDFSNRKSDSSLKSTVISKGETEKGASNSLTGLDDEGIPDISDDDINKLLFD